MDASIPVGAVCARDLPARKALSFPLHYVTQISLRYPFSGNTHPRATAQGPAEQNSLSQKWIQVHSSPDACQKCNNSPSLDLPRPHERAAAESSRTGSFSASPSREHQTSGPRVAALLWRELRVQTDLLFLLVYYGSFRGIRLLPCAKTLFFRLASQTTVWTLSEWREERCVCGPLPCAPAILQLSGDAAQTVLHRRCVSPSSGDGSVVAKCFRRGFGMSLDVYVTLFP